MKLQDKKYNVSSFTFNEVYSFVVVVIFLHGDTVSV